MPLTVLANAILRTPTLRLLIEQGGEKFATEDTYPEGTLGGEWQRRIIAEPRFTVRESTENGPQIDAITYTLSNHDGHFADHFTAERRKQVVIFHLVDVLTGEIQERFFRGEITQPIFVRWTATFVARSLDPAGFDVELPRTQITADEWPTSRASGTYVATGIGVALRVPCRHLSASETADGAEDVFAVAKGNVGIKILYEDDTDIPIRVRDAAFNPSPLEVYQVRHRVVINSRECTAIVFNQIQRELSTGRLPAITADLERYMEMDDATLAEWKMGSFYDELGVHHWIGFGGGTDPVLGTGEVTFTASAALTFSADVRIVDDTDEDNQFIIWGNGTGDFSGINPWYVSPADYGNADVNRVLVEHAFPDAMRFTRIAVRAGSIAGDTSGSYWAQELRLMIGDQPQALAVQFSRTDEGTVRIGTGDVLVPARTFCSIRVLRISPTGEDATGSLPGAFHYNVSLRGVPA